MYLVFIFLMSQIHPYILKKIIWSQVIHKNTHNLRNSCLNSCNLHNSYNWITHVTYIIYVPHMVKLALKANKKNDKIFLYNFFIYIKMLSVNK